LRNAARLPELRNSVLITMPTEKYRLSVQLHKAKMKMRDLLFPQRNGNNVTVRGRVAQRK
jgi:hypothetical protein